jgi:dihydrofolate reductase
VHSIEEAMDACPEETESFVIGGAKVYQQFFSFAKKLYITHIHKAFKADTHFPKISPDTWEVEETGEIHTDEKSGLDYRYITYKRKA